jgi:integrase
VLRSITDYTQFAACNAPLLFTDFTPVWLKGYERYLITQRHCLPNTTSTYLRCLRTIYHHAVQQGKATYTPFLFRDVFTGVRRNHTRALTASEVRRLITFEPPAGSNLAKARICFMLMFGLQGLSFVDLAYLKKSCWQGDYLVLLRHKTEMPLRIRLLPDMQLMLRRYASTDASSPYLFPILDPKLTGEALHRDYSVKLRRLNKWLHRLGITSGLNISVSSYCARHTWATLAKYCHIPVTVIAECLGHSSPTTTESYLKGYDDEVMAHANRQVMAAVSGA